MITGIFQATPEQVKDVIDLKAMPWAEASRPLCVGMWQGECLCIFGTIPTSLLSDSAYLWLWTAPRLATAPLKLRIVFAYNAKGVIAKLLGEYGCLICNCFSDESAYWLRRLGATQTRPDLFEFRR